jgi:hypothetical protein
MSTRKASKAKRSATRKLRPKHLRMTKAEHTRFNFINKIHPSKWTPQESYEFYLLLGKHYLGAAYRKSKRTADNKKFRRDQGYYALGKATRIRAKYKLKPISL